jgi:hypothetical protein
MSALYHAALLIEYLTTSERDVNLEPTGGSRRRSLALPATLS